MALTARIIIALILLTSVAFAADDHIDRSPGVETIAPSPPPPVAVIQQQDLNELQAILDSQVPPHWSPPIVAWVRGLIERQKQQDKK